MRSSAEDNFVVTNLLVPLLLRFTRVHQCMEMFYTPVIPISSLCTVVLCTFKLNQKSDIIILLYFASILKLRVVPMLVV